MKIERARLALPGKKWTWLLICIVIIGLLTAFPLLNSGPTRQEKPSFSSAPPTNSTPTKNGVSCLGRLLPGGRILQVAAPPGTVIGELLARRGRWVEQGEILARLRDHARETAVLHQLEKEVAVAESEYDRVRAGEKTSTIEAQQSAVARQEAILRREQTNYERYRKLYEKRIIAARDFDEAQTRRDAAHESLLWERQHLGGLREIRKEDLALAVSKVEAAKDAWKVGQKNVELTLVRAPVSGRILEINAFPGEAVRERGILEMGIGRDVLVEAEVYVSDIGRVRMGAPAVVSGDALPESLKGEVVEIASMVTRGAVLPSDPLAFSDLRVVKTWIRLDHPQAVAHLGNHQVSVVIKP